MNQKATTIAEFEETLAGLLPTSTSCVVAYTSSLTIGMTMKGVPQKDLPTSLLQVLLRVVGEKRTLVMPTHTHGYRDGAINLDTEPCHTGMMNEAFRLLPGTRRSLSAFFSFAALGPLAQEVFDLKPKDAWGDGSLFQWMEAYDATILMIGLPWWQSSYFHRVEWLNRVPYRYSKEVSGIVTREGKTFPLTERLFVRSMNPPVENAWPDYEALCVQNGMRMVKFGRTRISVMSTKNYLGALMPVIQRDPYAFVQNAEAVKQGLMQSPTPST